MDKKLTFTGGEPDINIDDILRDPIADRAALFAIMEAFEIGTNENFIISGCEPTLSTGVNVVITAGYIFLNGEILEVEAQTVADAGTLDLYKYTKSTTYDSGGDKTFNDGTSRQTWQKNRGTVVAATTPILTTELDVIDGDSLVDKIGQSVNEQTLSSPAGTNGWSPNINSTSIDKGGNVQLNISADGSSATADAMFTLPSTHWPTNTQNFVFFVLDGVSNLVRRGTISTAGVVSLIGTTALGSPNPCVAHVRYNINT